LPDLSQTRAMFVHGGPEMAAIWGPILSELQHPDTVALSPPGVPVPDSFGTTGHEYVAWLASELERHREHGSIWSATTGAPARPGRDCVAAWPANPKVSPGLGALKRWTQE
jgi:hypothetical protein